jgi:hypothetical protein
MDKYITRSLKIVRGEWMVDEQSFKHALNELKQRVRELSPLFNECALKDISIKELAPSINDEFNLLIQTINDIRRNNS